MSLRHLRTLVAIADRGGFSVAADAIGLTQSAVSLQMKALEDSLGVALFDRSGRYPVLTRHGRIVVERARTVLALHQRLGSDLDTQSALAGELHLGAVHTTVTSVLPPALRALRNRHPQLNVHVRSGLSADLSPAVAAGELDAALITEPLVPPAADLVWHPVVNEPLFVVAPHDTPGQTDADVLTALPFIRFERTAWAGQIIDAELRRRGIQPRDGMELDSLEAIWVMVGHGLGVAVIPRHPIMDLPNLMPVRQLPFGRPQLSRRVGLLERQSHARTDQVAALLLALIDAH